MAKTTTDPVEAAREALDQAQRARDEADARMDDFKSRILDGADDVSPRDYGDAAHELEHAELKVQAAAIALQAAERDARHRTLQDLRAEILAETGTPEEALKDWRDLAEIAGRIAARCAARQRNIARWHHDLHRNRVPERNSKTGPDPEHAGLSWARAGMGVGDSVLIDGRRIQMIDAGMIIGSAAVAGARAAGVNYLRLEPNRQIEDDPERWFRASY